DSRRKVCPKRMLLDRASGILLHPSSLPNGVLDEHAFRFVDWLAAAGQRWWQVLPLGPPEGITSSPYMSPSAFAGSPALLAPPRACRPTCLRATASSGAIRSTTGVRCAPTTTAGGSSASAGHSSSST